MEEEQQKSREQNISIKLNNVIMNSENTASSNVMNTNTSFKIKKKNLDLSKILENHENIFNELNKKLE